MEQSLKNGVWKSNPISRKLRDGFKFGFLHLVGKQRFSATEKIFSKTAFPFEKNCCKNVQKHFENLLQRKPEVVEF